MSKQTKSKPKRPKVERSPIPYYAAGFIWVLYALIFPLYRITDFVIVGAISLLVFFLLFKAIPPKKIEEPVTEETIKIDIENDPLTDVEKAIAEGELYLDAIKKLNRQITTYNTNISQEIAGLEKSIQKIFDHLKANPEDAPKVRRFTDYYMPTALKLLRTYVDIQARGVQGENSSEIISNIEGVIHTMSIAFEKQLDKLYADDAVDISADITVLEHMLSQEGLTEK